MANVIIGIHGLGNKPPKDLLEKWWRLSMAEGLKTNSLNVSLPKFEMVYWADIIHDKPLDESEKDRESPFFLEEGYSRAPEDFLVENHETRQKIVGFLSRQMNRIFLNPDFSLNYSFIADTIVKNYFRDLEIYYTENCVDENNATCKVKDLIRKRLLGVLEKYEDDDIMLVSHSMGSIIAFDVLSLLPLESKIHTFITMGSPLGLPVVISKIAAEQKQRLNGKNHMVTPDCITNNWYNFSDILDKVAFNYNLSDDFSSNIRGVKPIDFLVVNNYEKNGIRNPHKSFGYLRTREFSKVLYDFMKNEDITVWEKITRRPLHIIRTLKTKLSSTVKPK